MAGGRPVTGEAAERGRRYQSGGPPAPASRSSRTRWR